MLEIVGIAGIGGLIIGSLAAGVADVFPVYRSDLQSWGGGLLIGGVALLGLVVPMI